VAEKTRRRPKKSATGMSRKAKNSSRASRRPSQSARALTRTRVSVAKPAHRRKPEPEGAAALGMNAKKTTQRQGFKTHEYIVYPAHGVGQIMAIEEQEVAGARLELFVINFVKDKMTLRVPTAKVASVGMRKLAETPMVKRALETLKGRARIKRTMWSRRAQEYEAKINSGDIVAIAEVVRDLYRSENQPEQSYSERQLYEAALDRLSREVAAVQRITETEAVKEIEAALAKGPRRGPKPDAEDESVVEEEAA
jgi:CarD family transcriptional regulator